MIPITRISTNVTDPKSTENGFPDPSFVPGETGKRALLTANLRKSFPLACSGLSGGAALMYEVLWNRSFLTLTGSTTLAVASVVASFLGGLALGSLLTGRRIRALRNPKRFYVFAECLIAVYALLLQVVLPRAGTAAYAAIWPHLNGDVWTQSTFHLGLGLLFLGPGAFLMGSTFPLLLAIMGPFRVPEKAGTLYAANAFGGFLGALLAGFGTLPHGGMGLTLIVAVFLNLSSALLGLFSVSPEPPIDKRPPPSENIVQSTRTGFPVRDGTLILVLLGISGMTALGLEIVWTRLLILLIGSSTYAFALLTAVAVLGIGLGSWGSSRLAGRLRSPRLVVAHLELGILVCCIVALLLFQKLPFFLLEWLGTTGFNYANTLIADAVTALLSLFPPFFLFGFLFPVAAQSLQPEGGGGADRSPAMVYAALGFGNMLGAWATPAFLIPRFGLQGTVEVLGLIALAIAVVLALELRGSPRQRTGTLVAGGAIGLLLFLLPPWHPLLMTTGIYREAPLYWNLLQEGVPLHRLLASYRLLYYKEGLQTTVSVVERPGLAKMPYQFLAVDGKVDASTGADMNTEILSGHIPLLLHPAPRNVLVIGLASGVTAGAVEQHGSVRSLTVAEIEPAVVDAARTFQGVNHRALSDPRFRLVLDDGRHYLSTTRASFDVIVSEPSNPWMSGPSRLFTREFFRTAESRLTPNGLFAQWLPLYGLPSSLLKTEIRTFLDVFPHADLFQVAQGDLLLVGSSFPLDRWSRSRLSRPVVTDLARLKRTPSEVWGMFVAGTHGLRAWVRQGPLNTDRNALLEFGSPPYLLVDTLPRNRRSLDQIPWKDDLDRWVKGNDGESSPAVAYALARIALNHRQGARADYLTTLLPPPLRHEMRGRIADDQGFFRIAQREWTLSSNPASIRLLARRALEEGKGKVARKILSRLGPGEVHFEERYLRGLAFMEDGRVRGALTIFSGETPSLSDSRHILLPFLKSVLEKRQGDPKGAEQSLRLFRHLLDGLRQDREMDQGNLRMTQVLHTIRQWSGPVLKDDESDLLKRTVQERLVSPLSLYYRGVSLLWTGQTSKAVRVLKAYLNLLPPDERKNSRAFVFLTEGSRPVSKISLGALAFPGLPIFSSLVVTRRTGGCDHCYPADREGYVT
ncbi:MAG: fused MFS/spermidine synthase [Nitrospirota bacterium]|nr:fused MFS/spermidine synthase [Nitrospirota bacterium]